MDLTEEGLRSSAHLTMSTPSAMLPSLESITGAVILHRRSLIRSIHIDSGPAHSLYWYCTWQCLKAHHTRIDQGEM